MRKLLIIVLIALLLLVTIYSVIKGISIGNIKILGFKNIKSESAKIDTQIAEITSLKEQTYKKSLSDIESNSKTLLQEKEKYATLVSTSTDSEVEKATHGQNYEQDFLWAKVGNHATAQGVKLKFEIKVGELNKENYDLYFTVTGKYTNITEFVMALENDNLLGFKIENFKLVPGGSTTNSSSTNSNNTTTNSNTSATATPTSTANAITSNNTNVAEETKTEEKGILQATFKVTDIVINIDRSKITTSNNTNTNSNTNANNAQTSTNQVAPTNAEQNTTVPTETPQPTASVEGVVEPE